MDDFFDIVVAGPHLGGLLAAALLIKRGKKVLLLSVPNTKENDNWEKDPNDRIFTNFVGHWFLKKALDELAALPGRTCLVKPLDPSFQIVMPRLRVDVRSGEPAFLERLAEEFDENPTQVCHLFQTLNKIKNALHRYILLREINRAPGFKGLIRSGLRSLGLISLHKAGRERFGDLLARYPFGPSFRTALMSQVMSLSRLYSLNPSVTSAAHCLSMVQNGAFGLSFERPSLASMLKSFIMERGGLIIPEATIRRIVFTSKRARAVYLDGEYKPYYCVNLLVNTDMHWFYEMLPEEIKDREYFEHVQGIRAAGFHYRLHFQVRHNVVPVGMGERVLFIADIEKPLLNDNFLSLVLGPHDSRNADLAGIRILTVTARIPSTPGHSNTQRMAELNKKIMAHLKALIPFFEDNLVHVNSSIYPSMEPGKAKRCPPCYTWFFESTFNPSMGLSLLPNFTPYPNVFLTGDEVLPGMGLDGMVISGCFVADAIAGRSTRFI
jgi:phytoene dehydrogenase-like protein